MACRVGEGAWFNTGYKGGVERGIWGGLVGCKVGGWGWVRYILIGLN